MIEQVVVSVWAVILIGVIIGIYKELKGRSDERRKTKCEVTKALHGPWTPGCGDFDSHMHDVEVVMSILRREVLKTAIEVKVAEHDRLCLSCARSELFFHCPYCVNLRTELKTLERTP